MSDISIRKTGRAGRITLTRAHALNAMSYDMCLAVEAALDAWSTDNNIDLVIIDAEGDKAFCAGGDIQQLYDTGRAGDFGYGRRFWRDEYRLNARIAEYPKPYIAFMQGFTMGGGVGISCHGSHRVVCDSSQIAMPECGIGLVPDVGGSLLLARAPGRLGEYLGLTAERMGPADAIHAGFADTYISQEKWPDVIARLEDTGDARLIDAASETPPQGTMSGQQSQIDTLFAGDNLAAIVDALKSTSGELSERSLKAMRRNSPLAMACVVDMVNRQRSPGADIRSALELEYRFTFRAMEHGDFLEGIRAAVIDKDRNPKWKHDLDTPPTKAAEQMLMPLGDTQLTFDHEGPRT